MTDDLKVVGLQFKADGSADFKTSLKEINAASKENQSSLKLLKSQYDQNTSATQKLKNEQQYLTKQVDLYKDKTTILRKELEQMESAENRDEEAISKKKTQLNQAEAQLNKYESALDDVNTKLKTHQAELEEWSKKITSVGDKMQKVGDGMTKYVTGSLAAASTAMVGVTEETREYRTAMGKLNTAFTTNGKSAAQAETTYKQLQSVLGDSDVSVEAANHLAQLCDDEQDLQAWTKICTGVFATFGDSLPIEGLTEAANETAKCGAVTGPFADALNWTSTSAAALGDAMASIPAAQQAFNDAIAEGMSNEDAFNEALAACSDESERAAIITNTMAAAYDGAAASYEEGNADLIEANKATEDMAASMADLGAAAEPIVTTGKQMVSEFLVKAADAATELSKKFQSLSPDTQKLILKAAGIAAAIGPVLSVGGRLTKGIGKVVGKVPNIIKGVQSVIKIGGKLKTALMALNPTTLIIIAVIGSLIAIGVALYKNWDTIKAYAIKIWNAIKTTVITVVNGIKTGVTTAFNAVKTVAVTVWTAIKTAIITVVNAIKTGVMTVFNGVKTFVTSAFNGIKTVATTAWNAIKTAILTPITTARDKLSGIISAIKSKFSFGGIAASVAATFNAVKSKITAPIETAKNIVSSAISKIKSLFNVHLSFPKIKLPHFKITGGKVPWGIGGKGTAPKIDIQWYRRAYETAAYFAKPTLMTATDGSIKGYGDGPGGEFTVGENKLRSTVASGVASASGLLDPQVIYQAARQGVIDGMSEATVTLKLNDREVARTLRTMGAL